jgi:hypothetical protein
MVGKRQKKRPANDGRWQDAQEVLASNSDEKR